MNCLFSFIWIKMRNIVLFALIAFAVAEKDYYKIKDEHYDVNALIANRVALQAFADCFEDKGPCSDEYIGYKSVYFYIYIYCLGLL